MKKMKNVTGTLVVTAMDVEAFNHLHNEDFDGYIFTPQTGRNRKQELYGFYGIPLNTTEVYLVETYYR